jgi:hypothetical protein
MDVKPKRMRSTGMMAANENNDKIVDRRLNKMFSAIYFLYGGTKRRMRVMNGILMVSVFVNV